VARKASKKSHRLDPRTTQAAGYLMLLTSLPAAQHSSEAVLSIYRNRWQIELGFKRLKSLGDIDGLPTADPDLTRAWLLAHLIAAVLTEDLAHQILDFSPCGRPAQTALDLADLEAGTRHDPPRHSPPAAH
jgi:hypothetical protein